MADTFTLARRLKAGETVYTGWCGLPYPLVTEVIAREGFAAVTIDSQHGLWDTASIVAAVAAVRQGGAAPVVRVPVGGFASISRALDFGAEGIIAPMINTRSPIFSMCLNAIDSSQSIPMWMLGAASERPGSCRSLPRGAPLPTKMASNFSSRRVRRLVTGDL